MTELELMNLLEGMTLDEKVGQLVQLSGEFFSDNEAVITFRCKSKNPLYDDLFPFFFK